MPKKPFIDRKNAKHYHLVHRSQRDPLIVDENASQHVLKETIPINLYKHKDQDEINEILAKSKPAMNENERESKIGQAALYGVYFDDAEYDYTQHLRSVGEEPNAIIVEAPAKRKEKDKEKKKQEELKFIDDDMATPSTTTKFSIDIPLESLPSKVELSRGILAEPAIPEGLQPDMDPRLREIFEALQDDAYVEEDLEEDFWSSLNADGEAFVPEDDYSEEGEWSDYESEEDEGEESEKKRREVNWEDDFKKFKAAERRTKGSDGGSQDDQKSGTTGYSMSSSAMFRNKQLTLLDERFEKIEKEYIDEDEDDEDSEDEDSLTPRQRMDRSDLDTILDDFLDKYEVVGRKMVPRLEGDTAVEKLETIRSSLLVTGDDKTSIYTAATSEGYKKRDKFKDFERPVEREREAWDVQSVLSTYSNLENHPQMIGVDGNVKTKKILIDHKSGMPVVVNENGEKIGKKREEEGDQEKSDGDSQEESEDEIRENLGVRRPKKETPEEKRARKTAVKAAKQDRRVEKKLTKQAFKKEEMRQTHVFQNVQKNTGIIGLS